MKSRKRGASLHDDWNTRANCQGISKKNYNTFFPTEDDTKRSRWDEAFRFCVECPVRKPCLDLALSMDSVDDRYGMFGGFTPKERKWLRRGLDYWKETYFARLDRIRRDD